MKISCAACGTTVELPEKVGFRDTCPSCGAWLHSCVQCRLWVNNYCTEPSAEKVREPEGMNYCDWYQARDDKQETGDKEKGRSEAEELWRKLTKK